MTTSDDLPFRALHVPEPRLVFGFSQSDEYTRRGLYLYGPLDSEEALGPIRYGFVGAPEGLLLLQKWSQAMQRFTPAHYREGSPSRHPIPFPGFQAAYGAPWPLEPVASCVQGNRWLCHMWRQHDEIGEWEAGS
jgi:hypothetical protein